MTAKELTALLGLVCMTALVTGPAYADDWPEWRGKGRSGIWTETGILDTFPENGLTFKWRVPIRAGYAGPAVADGRVFVLDRVETPGSRTMDGTERLLALDEATGEILWTYEWPATYRMLVGSYATGPRATPTVDGDRVYVVGAAGMLLCLKVDTGELVWQKNPIAEYNAYVSTWGVASAPLVDGDRLICIIGAEPDGKVMAFDKYTGEEIWRALSSDWEMGQGQPVIYEAGGVRQLIIWHPKAVSSLDPATGAVYWEEPIDVPSGLTIATPVRRGPYLLVSHFYGGSMMMRLNRDRPEATIVWRGKSNSEFPDATDGLHALLTTPIIEGDYIYGVGSYGEFRGLNALTGERLWHSTEMTVQDRWGTAFIVRHGDPYFVNNEEGDLIIAKFTPAEYIEIDRTKLIEPTSEAGFGVRRYFDRLVNWSHPAYANRYIFARNDREIVSASLAKE